VCVFIGFDQLAGEVSTLKGYCLINVLKRVAHIIGLNNETVSVVEKREKNLI